MNEETLFFAVMDLDEASRDAFLQKECQGNDALRLRVLALLQSHDRGGEFLRRPAMIPWLTSSGDSTDHAASTSHDTTPEQSRHQNQVGEERFHATPEFLADLPDALRQALQPTTNTKAFGRVGHYDLLDILGVGGFGIVIKAFDQTLQRLVAIKFLASDVTISPSTRQRFLREARVAAAVRNDYVVDLFAVVEHPLPYLVMEFIDGVTLEQWRRSHPSPTVAAILRMGLQICEGLAAAHQQGLIHRDIKPANILVEKATQRVKITDFGLARAVDDTTLTRTNFILGTPQYMSPEQAEGKRVDERSDLFSLGSLLYWLCTNTPPFTGESTLGVLKQVCDIEPPPLRSLNPSIPQFLETFVQQLHRKAPSTRLGSAVDAGRLLAQALVEWEARGEISRPWTAEPANRVIDVPNASGVAKHRALTMSLAVTTIFVLIGLWIHGANRSHRRMPESSAMTTARGNQSPIAQTKPILPREVAADHLDPAHIPEPLLALAGEGDPQFAPPGLVAILAESRFLHALGLNRNSGVTDIACSRDGRLLASSAVVFSFAENRFFHWECHLWDRESGKLLRALENLPGAPRGLVFSPDSRQLAIVCDQGSLWVVPVEEGDPIWTVQAHAERGRAVDWSADGQWIVTAGDNGASIWNATDGVKQMEFTEHHAMVLDVAFAPPSLTAGTSTGVPRVASTDGEEIIVWNGNSGNIASTFENRSTITRGLIFSRDGESILSVSENGIVSRSSAENGTLQQEYRGHQAGVLAIDRSPDGSSIATVGLDGALRLWNVATGDTQHVMLGHIDHATTVAYSADGATVYSGDSIGRIHRWETATGAPRSQQHAGPVTALAVRADGTQLVSGGIDGTLRLWNLHSGEFERLFSQCTQPVSDVAIDDQRHRILAAVGPEILVFDRETGSSGQPFSTPARVLRQLAMNREGQILVAIGEATSSSDSIFAWDLESGALKWSAHPELTPNGLSVHPQDGSVAIGVGSSIEIRDLLTGALQETITGHTRPLRYLAFQPQGKLLASVADDVDTRVRLWNVDTREEFERLDSHASGAQSCHWRADGALLATCGAEDGSVQLWSWPNKQARRQVVPIFRSRINRLMGCELTPDGRHLITAHADGTMYVLRLADGERSP